MAMTPDTLRHLERQHEQYCDYNQAERSDDALMARLGHPFARQYRRLRRFFDRLRWACNASARRVSWRDAANHAEFWAPGLDLSWYPTGPGLERWVHVYPAHPEWEDYIKAAAAAGWPQGCTPGFQAGTWFITSTDPAMRAELDALGAAYPGAALADGAGRYGIHANAPCASMAVHYRVLRIVRRHQRDALLAPRAPADDERDHAPLPLERKRLMQANVEAVSVSARFVQVPLVPLDESGAALVQDIAARLVALVEDGFPFDQAGPWLRQFLTPDSYRALARRLERR